MSGPVSTDGPTCKHHWNLFNPVPCPDCAREGQSPLPTTLELATAKFSANCAAALAGDEQAEAALVILTMHSDPALAQLKARAYEVLDQIKRNRDATPA